MWDGRSSCLQVLVELPQLYPVHPLPSWVIKEEAGMSVPLRDCHCGGRVIPRNPVPKHRGFWPCFDVEVLCVSEYILCTLVVLIDFLLL